ncbi:hypothetical protein JCM18750_21020 [Halostagnicola bangensis]
MVSCSLAGCTNVFNANHKQVHIEFINAYEEEKTFNFLMEEDSETVVWDSFQIEGAHEADGSVGQLVPNLRINSKLDGPLSLRFRVDDLYEDRVLENGTFEWTSDRTKADIHVSFWLQEDGRLNVRKND